jgi:hypothetical protein
MIELVLFQSFIELVESCELCVLFGILVLLMSGYNASDSDSNDKKD